MESRNSPEREEVKPKPMGQFILALNNIHLTFFLQMFIYIPSIKFVLVLFRGHQQRRSPLKPLKMPSVRFCFFQRLKIIEDADALVSCFSFGLSPSSWQCWYGGAGEGTKETSGREVPEGPLWGNSSPLWCQGTTVAFSFHGCVTPPPAPKCFAPRFSNDVFLSLAGHPTAEQTQSDLWDHNQVCFVHCTCFTVFGKQLRLPFV